jgi:uncharacterized DUF497 family protein
MDDDAVDWDEAKAKVNYAKHGVRFDDPRRVFDDPFAVEFVDDREDYGEVRFNIIGMVDARLLLVAYTLRNDVIRIISARGAVSYEKRRYQEENS